MTSSLDELGDILPMLMELMVHSMKQDGMLKLVSVELLRLHRPTVVAGGDDGEV
jgi:hypothetical protein